MPFDTQYSHYSACAPPRNRENQAVPALKIAISPGIVAQWLSVEL